MIKATSEVVDKAMDQMSDSKAAIAVAGTTIGLVGEITKSSAKTLSKTEELMSEIADLRVRNAELIAKNVELNDEKKEIIFRPYSDSPTLKGFDDADLKKLVKSKLVDENSELKENLRTNEEMNRLNNANNTIRVRKLKESHEDELAKAARKYDLMKLAFDEKVAIERAEYQSRLRQMHANLIDSVGELNAFFNKLRGSWLSRVSIVKKAFVTMSLFENEARTVEYRID